MFQNIALETPRSALMTYIQIQPQYAAQIIAVSLFHLAYPTIIIDVVHITRCIAQVMVLFVATRRAIVGMCR